MKIRRIVKCMPLSNWHVVPIMIVWRLILKKQFRLTTTLVMFQHFLIIQLRSESSQIKRYLRSSITNLVHELPHELSNDLRPRILGNQEILEKCQMWVETQPNAQFSLQNIIADNSYQKTSKIRSYIFEVLSNFTVFLYFVPNIFSRNV